MNKLLALVASSVFFIVTPVSAATTNLPSGTHGLASIDVLRGADVVTVEPIMHRAHQDVLVINAGTETAHDVILEDILTTADGIVLQTVPWTIGDMEAGDSVTLQYDIEFGPRVPSGSYVVTAHLNADGKELAMAPGQVVAPEPASDLSAAGLDSGYNVAFAAEIPGIVSPAQTDTRRIEPALRSPLGKYVLLLLATALAFMLLQRFKHYARTVA